MSHHTNNLATDSDTPQNKVSQVTLDGFTMGMTYQIKYITNPNLHNLASPTVVKEQIDALLEEVNEQMSTYRHHSEISRFNQMTITDTAMTISADFAQVIIAALQIHKLTQGGLDITLGPLVNLWDFGPDDRPYLPTEEEITNCTQSIGMQKLYLYYKNGEAKLSKSTPKLYLDLSSIAKGFGVDKVADYLHNIGIDDYLIDIGGELRANGVNLLGNEWRVAIEKPNNNNDFQIIIPLRNHALATSGDYRNCYEDDQGQRLSHVICPKTKRPVQSDIASISVLEKTTMRADGIATGLYVLGAKRALEIAECEKIAVFLIVRENSDTYKTMMSSAFRDLTT